MPGFAVLSMVAVISTAGLAPTSSPLRPQSARLQHAVDLGLRSAPSFRWVVNALSAYRAIIVIVAQPCDFGRREACLVHHVVTAEGYRFLRVHARDDVPYVRLAGLIAHELWHALEAVQADLVDADGFARLFAANGSPCEQTYVQACYETDAAVAFQAGVVNELSGGDLNRRQRRAR